MATNNSTNNFYPTTMTGMVEIATANGGSLNTDTTTGHTLLLRAYNVTGVSYTTFATLTADTTTPTMDLNTAVTINSAYIYRAGGTDIPVTDGGTGLSATTAYAVLCGGTTSTAALQSIAALGSAGDVLTSNGAGALPTFQAAGSGFTWAAETGATKGMAASNGYIANYAGALVFTLPASASMTVGQRVAVCGGTSTSWQIAQNASQVIHLGNASTTAGVGGSITSTNLHDVVELLYTAADTFTVIYSVGNITYA
jgi:hypothetical protein